MGGMFYQIPCHLDFLTAMQYYLDYETRGTETTNRTVRTASQDWVWMPIPEVEEIVP